MKSDTSAPIRVFLISTHRCILWGFERLVESAQPPMHVAGSATSYAEALERLAAIAADVILFDIDPGRANGIAAVASLKARSPAKILVLTGLRDESVHDDAVLAGASGVVRKESPAETVVAAIAKVHGGELWLDRATTARIFGQISQIGPGQTQNGERAKIESLTGREREIIALSASHPGATGEALAQMLRIRPSTLRNHFTSIYDKLGLSNRLALCAYAYKHDLMPTSRVPQNPSHRATAMATRSHNDASAGTDVSTKGTPSGPFVTLRSGNG